MSRLHWMFVLILLSIPHVGRGGPPSGPTPIVAQALVKDYTLHPSQISELKITVSLKSGFKAYADQFKVRFLDPAGFRTAGIHISPMKEFFDKVSGKKKKGLIGSGEIRIPFEAPHELSDGNHMLLVSLTYQACTDAFCLFPETIEIKAPFEFQPFNADAAVKKTDLWSDIFSMDFKQAFHRGLLWTFVFVFFAGILTSFTPCIFPMIPITLTVLGRNAHARTRWQNLLVSLMYVLGIAITYSIMGVVAASTGALFGSFMSHPAVLTMMCLVFLAMSLSMFGLFEIHAPVFIENRFATSDDLTGYSGAFFSGVMSGVVASPCVGPVLVGILTYIAKTQDLWLGFFLMFTYALGMGQIFLLLGSFSQVTKLLPKSGPWLDGIKNFFGILMLGVFYYFLGLLISQRWWDLLLGLGLITLASYMGAFKPALTTWKSIRKGLLLSMAILGCAFIVVSAFEARSMIEARFVREKEPLNAHDLEWIPFSQAALDTARLAGKPVIVDFHAQWCAACKELDQYTFSKDRFQLMAKNFILMKFDATKESPELEVLRTKYEIIGLPTVLFFNSKGEHLKDLTLTAFENVDPFVERMLKAMK